MRSSTVVPVLLFALLVLLPAAPATALDWGLGADLGMSVFMPDYEGADNISLVGWPMGATFVFGELPLPSAGGLRLSFSGANPMHEVWIGTSFNRTGVEGMALHAFGMTGNYQFNFATQGAFTPYVTAGAGLFRVGFSPDHGDGMSATSATFGGGVGLGYVMAGGAGRLRAEVRYAQLTEGTHEGSRIIPKGGEIGFRFGFDVWSRAKQ